MARFVVAAALVSMAGTAWAQRPTTPYPAEVQAKVSSVDAKLQLVTLDDGTQLWATSPQQISGLKPGTHVSVTYVDTGDRKEITTIKVMQ